MNLAVVTAPIDPNVLDERKVHTLAARKLIQDLEDKRGYLHNNQILPKRMVLKVKIDSVNYFVVDEKYRSTINE